MTGSAKVISVSGDLKYAVVETERKSACEGCHKGAEGCAACSLLGPNRKISCRAENTVGARKGDTVEIESSSGRMLGYAAAIFILPVLLGIVGYLISGIFTASEPIRAAGAGVGFLISFAAVAAFSYFRSKKTADVKIVRIMKGCSGEE